MTRLADLPVRVMQAPATGGIGGIEAILHEIAGLLERLCACGESGAIDLRSLPMTPAETGRLKEFLGVGEVRAGIDAQGRTLIHETAFHGVWWVVHHASDESVVAELIEVTLVPEVLKSHRADAGAAVARLRAVISQGSPSSTPT